MNQLSFPQAQSSQSSIQSPPLIYRIKQYQPNTLLSKFSFMLIRPPRFMYNQQLLLPPQNYQMRYKVQTYQIPFKLTLYKPDNMLYVVLYLHGNSSSRFQGYMQLKQLPDSVGLACFDFNGCGMRFDADYITLGSKQSKQVDIAVRYLKGLGYKVVGWGRSMGSVSLLLSEQVDIMVADSPFYSLQGLCKQSTYKVTPAICCCFFHCLYPCLFSCVRSDVQQRAGFDVRELQVAKTVANNPKNKNRSLFIMAGNQDNMINFSHSQKIFDGFPGKKQIQIFSGTHNSNRPYEVIKKAFEFIQQQLSIKRQPFHKKLPNIKLKPMNKQFGTKIMVNQQITASQKSPVKKQQKQSVESVKKIDGIQQISSFNINIQQTSKNSNTIDTNSKIEQKKQQLKLFQQSPANEIPLKQKQKIQQLKIKQQNQSPANTSQTLIPN